MVESIGFKSLWLLARYVPGLLIRWRFPRERLASLVYVDVRPRHDSVVLELHPGGTARLYGQLINLCPTSIELDRAHFSLHCGGGEVKFVELAKRWFEIGEIAEMNLHAQISGEVAAAIARFPENPISLDGHIEFNSAVRPFAKSVGSLAGTFWPTTARGQQLLYGGRTQPPRQQVSGLGVRLPGWSPKVADTSFVPVLPRRWRVPKRLRAAMFLLAR